MNNQVTRLVVWGMLGIAAMVVINLLAVRSDNPVSVLIRMTAIWGFLPFGICFSCFANQKPQITIPVIGIFILASLGNQGEALVNLQALAVTYVLAYGAGALVRNLVIEEPHQRVNRNDQ